LIDFDAAAARLAPYARPTPLVPALLLSRDLDCDLRVKNETVSPIASFKWRGALNDILRAGTRSDVVTSSTGNHGQGVAWAARTTGVAAHIFLPLGANPLKRAKIALLGATIHDCGHDLDAAKELAIAFANDEGLRFIDDGESEGASRSRASSSSSTSHSSQWAAARSREAWPWPSNSASPTHASSPCNRPARPPWSKASTPAPQSSVPPRRSPTA
jgi:threonine synthase